MVELIVVIVLIGIIGSIGVGRYFERSSFDAAAWTEQVRAMLRYGQKVAVAQNRSVFVSVTAERVSLCFAATATCAAGNQVPAPAGGNSGSAATRAACASSTWMCEGRPAGLTMSGLPAAIAFDALGRVNGGLGSRLKVSVTGDGLTRDIGIEPETGYVD